MVVEGEGFLAVVGGELMKGSGSFPCLGTITG